MKRILFIVTIVCGMFSQQNATAQQRKSGSSFFDSMWIPMNDTIIFKGSTVQIGARFSKSHRIDAVEIEGFRKSKKSDLEKGFFAVEVSPKKHTTYQITAHIGQEGIVNKKRTVYVVTSEEEKKAIEEKMIKEKAYSSGFGVESASFRVMDEGAKKDTTKNNTNKK